VIGEDKMGRPDLRRIDGQDDDGEEEGERRSRRRGDRQSGRGDRSSGRKEAPKKPVPTASIKAGDIIEGTVTNTTDYGAFVELSSDVTGLIHISALSEEYVRRVTDIVRTGDHVTVEVMNVDERGRYKLRRIEPESERRSEKLEAEPVEDEEPAEPRLPEEEPVRATEEPEQPQAAEFEDRW